MSRTERKALLLQLAARRGIVSAVALLGGTRIASHSHEHNAGESAPADLLTISAPRYDSLNPFLVPSERAQLAADLRAYHLAGDNAAWNAGKARGMWLAVIPAAV